MTKEDRPLDGRCALVTGSTGEGMGRQTALTLARMGADVVINYGTYRRSRKAADATAKEIRAFGVGCEVVRADTRKEADTRRLVEAAGRAFGPVRIAVANAGGDFIDRPLDGLGLAAWKRVVDAELDGVFLLLRDVLPGMRKAKDGRIVVIGWDDAGRAYKPPYDYAIGKLARQELALKVARAEERHGVRINVVAPGYIPYPDKKTSQDMVGHGAAWRTRRRATTQDVADAVAWLCTDEARHVSGAFLRIYGPS